MMKSASYACTDAITGRFVFEAKIRKVTGRGFIIHEGYAELRNAKVLKE
ncbi:unnamed protein product, partial [marine sediment metagenome]